MKANPQPVVDPPETVDAAVISPSHPLADEEELTDEEAFYLAQEESFADLRIRYENRPRRKM